MPGEQHREHDFAEPHERGQLGTQQAGRHDAGDVGRRSSDGRELSVVAKGEHLKVMVPAGVPIVTFQPGDASMLKPGTHVFIGAMKAADGSLSAARVNAGRDGLTPPM